MQKAALILALAGLAVAQETPDLFSKAPPAVDEALRARIAEFYQAHVDGKYRAAEAVVADDTKDFFYEANKPKYLSYEIVRIQYSHDFTRAKATVLCEQYVIMLGFADKPLKVPTPSSWKIQDGKWYWWVDPEELRKTPWGVRSATADKPGAKGARPRIPEAAEMRFIFTQVQADKPKVSLKDAGEAEVKFTNGAKGSVKLVLPSVLLGLQASFDRTELKSGEVAVLRLKWPAGAKVQAGTIEISVEPTNQVVPIQVALEEATSPKTPDAPGAKPTVTQVEADKSKVALKVGGEVEVKLTNGTQKAVKLVLPPALLGLRASFDRTQLKPGEAAVLRLKRPKGAKARAGTIKISVEPTKQVVPIQIALE